MPTPRLVPVLLAVPLALAACKRSPSPDPRAGAEPAPAPAPSTPSPAPPADDPAAADLGPPSEAVGAPPAELSARLRLETVVSGLDRPVALVAVPGDARRRLWVVEQAGRIRVVEGGTLTSAVVLDLRRQVSRDGNEQGLLGLAFHPRFPATAKVYVNYTDRRGDTRVVEYQVAGDTVDATSARELLFVDQPYANHNGGHVAFGPDGKLWVGLGDGGAAGDPKRAGQDDRQLLAKMIRLDVDAARPAAEVVAKGLRNPWRYAFDPATGDLYIGDVGQNEWEEVDVVPADRLTGHNFGWNVAEARHCFDRRSCDVAGFTPPVVEYGRDAGCSITGGVVYRGRAIPELVGAYFYADYCTAIIRSFRWRPDGIRQHWEWKPALDPDSRLGQISSFGTDHDGELYLLSLGGDVYRLAVRE